MTVPELQALHRRTEREREREIMRAGDTRDAERLLTSIAHYAWKELHVKGDLMNFAAFDSEREGARDLKATPDADGVVRVETHHSANGSPNS